MSNSAAPTLPKWPFLLGDLLLIGFAGVIIYRGATPLSLLDGGLALLAALAGAWLSVVPFLRDQQAALKLGEAEALATTVAQIKDLERINKQITDATEQWNTTQEHSTQTVAAAKEMTERMRAELSGFCTFLQKTHDAEKTHLRLEVEKLRRSETEWLQRTVHILDHVFALHKAAARSGHPGLVAQLDQFQFACRDVARRAGLVVFVPAPDDPFDTSMHQLQNGAPAPQGDARVAETLAPGYSFQGQLVRRALVGLQAASGDPENAPAPAVAVLPASESLQA
jgi:molecular chaperone GrpE (heat shock protein)